MYIAQNQYITQNYTKNRSLQRLSRFDFGRNFPKICEILPGRKPDKGKKTSFLRQKTGQIQRKCIFI